MKHIQLVLFFAFLALTSYKGFSQTHPFLIVRESMYPSLIQKHANNQQPFTYIRNRAFNSWNNNFTDGQWEGMASLLNFNIITYMLETNPSNKVLYKNKILSILNRWSNLVPILNSSSHDNHVNASSALFNSIIALDIIYNALSPNELSQAENNIALPMNYFQTANSAWKLSDYGINLLYAIYKNDVNAINTWKTMYDDYLFDKSMMEDGSWGQSTGYVHARMHGSRVAKNGIIDVLEFTGLGNYYNDPRMKKLFEWTNTFAMTPFGGFTKFGDTGLTLPTALNNSSNLYYANKYGSNIGSWTAWNTQGVGTPSFSLVNYLIYILRDVQTPTPTIPTSSLREQTGAALWDKTNSREALQTILYSLKRDNPQVNNYGHGHQNANSFDMVAYGQHLICNSGVRYTNANGSGFNYPGFTPIGTRWGQAVLQNVVLIGNNTSHSQNEGNGLIDGLTGANVEFGTTDAGAAIMNGSHERTIHLIQPIPGKSSGYFAVYDEVSPSNSADQVAINFQVNSLAGSTSTITNNQEYLAPVNAILVPSFSNNTEKATLFFTSQPNVSVVKSYKGDFNPSVGSLETDNIQAQYTTPSSGTVRATTIVFPEDAAHPKVPMSKISTNNYNGGIISHSSTFLDYYIGADNSVLNTYSTVQFKANTTFFRKELGTTVSYATTNGTHFLENQTTPYGFESVDRVSITMDGNEGFINAFSQTKVTFYQKDIVGVKVDGAVTSLIHSHGNSVEVVIPQGRHRIELIVDPNSSLMAYGGTVHQIPGRVEAEHYNLGGQGIGYSDFSSGNIGNQLRTDDVDIEPTGDVSGGYNIGWTQTGEWLEYNVNCRTSGYYDFSARVASAYNTSKYKILVDGVDVTGNITIPYTGGWQTYQTISSPNIFLSAGRHIVRIVFVQTGVNINYWKVSSSQTPYGGVAHSIPGSVEAEHYDFGGEGVAYHDITAGNSGNQLRTDRVDIQATGDSYGIYNIGWTATGEWLEYTVNCATTANYDLYMRVASPISNAQYQVLIDGVDKTGVITVPNTGGWQTYQTVRTQNVMMSAGIHIIRIKVISGGFNLNDWAMWRTPSPARTNSSTITTINQAKEFTIYPNPANKQFVNLEFKALKKKARLQIIDVQGKVIKETFLTNSYHRIDLQDVHNGVYLIRITEDDYSAVKKLIVQE